MSEELIKRGLIKSGPRIVNYEFYDIGETTLNQLKQAKIIPNKEFGKYKSKKPDGLLVDRQNKSTLKVIVCLECKQPSEFKTNQQQKEAIEQCNSLCQVIEAKIGVITDGEVTFWINPHQINKNNTYIDDTTKTKRSYSFIINEDKKNLSERFIIQKKSETDYEKLDDDTKKTLDYIKIIISCIGDKNSTLKPNQTVDPLPLARSVWQDIYINTGKDPTKCLYNVVELFIFKFLSDLGVLKNPNDFDSLLNLYKKIDAKEVLNYYATNSRPKIRELFPAGSDKTTIINGTIFVTPDGKPVLAQAHLFENSLKKYKEFGSLKNVTKEFKTKLFETFIKESEDKSRLGQFLTPRIVVKAIVDMSDVENLPDGSRLCDPFCGVGGFICEPLHKERRQNDFIPRNKRIIPKIVYHGFDKGSDDIEERTIILAKANMLIYLSEIVQDYPTFTKEFARVFNDTFHLLTESNLGTLKIQIEKEEEKYDLILTNPPYITSGVASIREEIKKENLGNFYTAGGKGVDGLALEWIIRSLKKGGRAFVVTSLGILQTNQNKNLRKFILKECFINCIISLPIKTFFNTPQKTFILGITKKMNSDDVQDCSVFTYLVSNIGETLDINRFKTEGKSDLEKAKELFNSYKGSPKTFPVEKVGDLRCKLQPLERFFAKETWDIDKWWTKEERIKLGVDEEKKLISSKEFTKKLNDFVQQINKHTAILGARINLGRNHTNKEVSVSEIFNLEKGLAKYTKGYLRNHKGEYPVYSSQTTDKGVLGYIDSYDYASDCLTWTTDGIYAGTVFHRNNKFSMTTHCGALLLKEEYKSTIQLDYILFQLNSMLKNYATGEGNKRITVDIIKNVPIKIPINDKGLFDIKRQKRIAAQYIKFGKIKSDLKDSLSDIVGLDIEIIS